MATDEILRLHYYERQYLGAADLEDQQTYLRDMRRRHNLGHHTWGIVTGLDLVFTPVPGDPTAVNYFVQPGMAIDGFGREIIVMAPVQLDPALFASFNNLGPHDVYISYDQVQAQQPTGGFAQCNVSNQFGRIQETYKIEIDPNQPTHQDVMVNGKAENPASTDMAIPADDSVPYQEFPDDATDPLWLLQLGRVTWDGLPGTGHNKFPVPTSSDDLTLGRVYVGVVAQTIYAPESMPDPAQPAPANDAPRFVIQPRFLSSDPKAPDAADFAEIKGRLQVDGRIVAEKDLLLYGGQLQFLDTSGSDDKIPLWMQRTAGDGGVGTDLHVHIDVGPDPSKADQNRLSVGITAGAAEQTVLAVTAGNNVNIPTGNLNIPQGSLSFGAQTRQMINLWKPNYGIGVQSGTLYFRSDSDFRWWMGGKHDDDPTQPDNGTLQMHLDGSANLTIGGSLTTGGNITLPGTPILTGSIFFGAAERQMLNLWNANYGIGVQDLTQYFRSDSDFCWFVRGTHANGQSDPGGGTLSMKLDGGGNLSIAGNLSVGGNLNVSGSQNIFKVFTQTLALQNSPTGQTDVARPWTVNYAAWKFSEVYAAFVVFQGFSIWSNENNTNFSTYFHDSDPNAIPQHAYARIINYDLNQANGEVFCSESLASNESDNTVLFTVVVMGRS
jgi:hypothetical protein